jgi:hypothetical protein
MGATQAALLPDASLRTAEQTARLERAEAGMRRCGLAMGRALKARGGNVGLTHSLFRACVELFEAEQAGLPKDGEP